MLKKQIKRLFSLRTKAKKWAVREYIQWHTDGDRPKFWKRTLIEFVILDKLFLTCLIIILAALIVPEILNGD